MPMTSRSVLFLSVPEIDERTNDVTGCQRLPPHAPNKPLQTLI